MRFCTAKNCKKYAIFNYETKKIALYCATHKLEGMVNIINKKCIFKGCKTQPIYNFENEIDPIYCTTHKKEGMIDIKNKRCIFKDCKKHPSFNFKGETKRLYCATHKLEGMIDIKCKTCIFKDCKTQPIYNYEDKAKGIYCAVHKLENMVNVRDKICVFKNCKKIPNYNYKNKTKPIYCTIHKLENMVNVKSKTCLSELCNAQVKNKYKGYCYHCYVHLFPNDELSQTHRTKERDVIAFIEKEFPEHKWVFNKLIGDSRRRPDILLNFESHALIIEIDENQHCDYEQICENRRIMEISRDLGHIPLVLIRFNPDSYKKDDKIIPSCFSYSRTGICKVKDSFQWLTRLNSLKEEINKTISQTHFEKTITLINLFFDE